jgi:hypothetical protein
MLPAADGHQHGINDQQSHCCCADGHQQATFVLHGTDD